VKRFIALTFTLHHYFSVIGGNDSPDQADLAERVRLMQRGYNAAQGIDSSTPPETPQPPEPPGTPQPPDLPAAAAVVTPERSSPGPVYETSPQQVPENLTMPRPGSPLVYDPRPSRRGRKRPAPRGDTRTSPRVKRVTRQLQADVTDNVDECRTLIVPEEVKTEDEPIKLEATVPDTKPLDCSANDVHKFEDENVKVEREEVMEEVKSEEPKIKFVERYNEAKSEVKPVERYNEAMSEVTNCLSVVMETKIEPVVEYVPVVERAPPAVVDLPDVQEEKNPPIRKKVTIQ